MVYVIYEPNLKEGLYGKGGHGNPLQYSCPENPTDRGAWWATGHRAAEGQTRLKQLIMHAPSSPLVELRIEISNFIAFLVVMFQV